jgi:glycosyltransferase involved in cell wall biosynthesis
MKDVTIIIPAYNEVMFIEQAILSTISQAEFVIVSDNCSTDGTQEICKKLAKKFKNLIFHEQNENIGSIKNFEFLLSQVKTKYVLHIGAHDYVSDNYVSTLKECLSNNQNAVLAYSPYYTINENNEIINEDLLEQFEDKFISSNTSERVLATIEHREYIFTIFGLFKTETLTKNKQSISVAGIDCLLLSYCVNDGLFIRVPSPRFYRRVIERKESTEEYMKRIEGTTQPTQYDLSYMCTHQIELLKEINKDNLEIQNSYLNKATISMQRLYGKYCYKSISKTLSELSKIDEKYILYGAGLDSDYILSILYKKILFIVDQDPAKQNTTRNGIEIKSPMMLNQYENKIIISLIGRFELITKNLIIEYKINPNRFVLPIDYNYKILD